VIDRLFDHHGAVPLPFAAVSKRFCCVPHPGRAACVSCSHVNSNKTNDLMNPGIWSADFHGVASASGSHPFSV